MDWPTTQTAMAQALVSAFADQVPITIDGRRVAAAFHDLPASAALGGYSQRARRILLALPVGDVPHAPIGRTVLRGRSIYRVVEVLHPAGAMARLVLEQAR